MKRRSTKVVRRCGGVDNNHLEEEETCFLQVRTYVRTY